MNLLSHVKLRAKQSLVSLALVWATACGIAQTKPEAATIAAATKAANDASLQGHIEKNVDKICAVYAADAIILPPGGAPIRGIKNIREHYTAALRSGSSLKITTENIHYEVIDERHAQEVGSYSIVYRANDSDKSIEIKGFMLIAWEKDKDGTWKITLDMWH